MFTLGASDDVTFQGTQLEVGAMGSFQRRAHKLMPSC